MRIMVLFSKAEKKRVKRGLIGKTTQQATSYYLYRIYPHRQEPQNIFMGDAFIKIFYYPSDFLTVLHIRLCCCCAIFLLKQNEHKLFFPLRRYSQGLYFLSRSNVSAIARFIKPFRDSFKLDAWACKSFFCPLGTFNSILS